MSSLRSFRRKLIPKKAWVAQQVAQEKVKIAREVVIEKAKKDKEFAAEILKTLGEHLQPDVKAACEASVKESANDSCCGGHCGCGDTTHELTETIQMDGGGEILVHPAELLNYPRDGESLVLEEGPKVEKSTDEPEEPFIVPPPGAIIDEPLPPECQELVDKHIKKV